MSRNPGRERNPDLRREIRRIAEKCGCPVDRCREYVRFGLEFHRTLVRPPLPDFDRASKLVLHAIRLIEFGLEVDEDLLDAEACMRCGRCTAACPARNTDKPLDPKKIIQDLKANVDEKIPLWMDAKGAASSSRPS